MIYDKFKGLPYVTDLSDPIAAPGGVVIAVAATGLCRSDWHGWQGHDSDITTLPHVPGHEFAGTISAIGTGYTSVPTLTFSGGGGAVQATADRSEITTP